MHDPDEEITAVQTHLDRLVARTAPTLVSRVHQGREEPATPREHPGNTRPNPVQGSRKERARRRWKIAYMLANRR
ncbi:hypothetical protein [Nocardiopsis sp. NPDC055824]